ncbi:MAG TPA: serine/threonine-protein kinase [Polyangiaceae bacterium]|nr:serine/threonine-protein kinase [Polyangiaceae bacterium]
MQLEAPTQLDDTSVEVHREVRDEAPTRMVPSVRGARPEPGQESLALPDLLREEEASRARGFAFTSGLLAIVGLGAFPLISRGAAIEPYYIAALLVCISASAWMWWRSRDPRRYSFRVFRIFCVTALAALMVIVVYGGLFSPAVCVLSLGLSFAGMGDDRRWAIGVCVAGIIIYSTMCVLLLTGVITDYGLLEVNGVDAKILAFATFMTPCALVIALWQARLSRRATYSAVARLQQAMRLAQEREAQLQEVVHDLRVAREGGAGAQGRYTGYCAGAYTLGAVIGRGGMAEVYSARHVDNGGSAAVKVLAGAVHDDTDVRRFAREGAVAAALHAPNVVQVFEVGAFEDGMQYIVMELLRGTDLATLLMKSRLEHGELIKMVYEVAEGLEAVHAAGVIHRDVKPRNLFRTDGPHGVWKLLDFGVSRESSSGGTLTEGAVVGTPGYMSPEQARSTHAVDRRADVFSLGAVIYRCLTGQPPFNGASVPAVLYDIVYRQPIRPSRLAPWLPADVDLVLAIALAKDARDRFGGARDTYAALEAAFRGQLDDTLRARARGLLTTWPWRQVEEPGLTVRTR